MPGHDKLFLPLPFASAARAYTPSPMPDVDTGAFASAEAEAVIASAIGAWMDAADVAEAWRKLAEDRGRALRRIAELGDVAARTARLLVGQYPTRVSMEADAWNAYRMATIDAGLQVKLDDKI